MSSCIVESTVRPREESTAVIELTFLDEDLNEVTPSNLQWQLKDKNGTLINNNSFANNSFSGTTVVLSGDDLALQSDSDEGDRYFAVKGTYNSNAGNDLPLYDEFKFTICDLINVTNG